MHRGSQANQYEAYSGGIIQDQEYFKAQIEPHLDMTASAMRQRRAESARRAFGNAYALLHPISF